MSTSNNFFNFPYPPTPQNRNRTRRNLNRDPYPNLPASMNAANNNNSNSTLTLTNGTVSGTSTPLSTKKRGLTWRNESRKNASLTNVRGSLYRNLPGFPNRFNRNNLEDISYRQSVQGSAPIFPREPLNAKLAALYANISSKYNNTDKMLNAIDGIPGLSNTNRKKLVRTHFYSFPPVETFNELTFGLRKLITHYYGKEIARKIFLSLPVE